MDILSKVNKLHINCMNQYCCINLKSVYLFVIGQAANSRVSADSRSLARSE
jgi:hypothetical protein